MARNRTPNTPIGTCPCPFRGCDQVGDLYRYRAQTDDPSKQRRAGKLYMRCPDHGMIHDQEWLLNKGVIPSEPLPGDPAPEPTQKPTELKTGDQAKPDTPASPAQEPKPDDAGDAGFGFFK